MNPFSKSPLMSLIFAILSSIKKFFNAIIFIWFIIIYVQKACQSKKNIYLAGFCQFLCQV
jgi:hypothetical protein